MRISDWSSDVCSSDLSWSLFNDRLSLKIGARNDRFENKNIAGDVYYDSGDNWQPRLGITLDPFGDGRSEEHTSELQSLMRISYAVFCLKKNRTKTNIEQKLTRKHIMQIIA